MKIFLVAFMMIAAQDAGQLAPAPVPVSASIDASAGGMEVELPGVGKVELPAPPSDKEVPGLAEKVVQSFIDGDYMAAIVPAGMLLLYILGAIRKKVAARKAAAAAAPKPAPAPETPPK